jgi:Flp pilus assembly protein TadG
MLIVLLAMVAFAIDMGYIVHARTELQRTADACALTAVARLPDRGSAELAAQAKAQENYGSVGPDLDASDIQYGYWDRENATLTSPAPFGKNDNAVRVTLRRTEATGNPLTLFFAHLLGAATADVTASATAMYDRHLCGPLIGIEWVSIPGTPKTDSFNSEEGDYAWGNSDRGGVCSDGPINVDGNALIRGDARAGKGHGVYITGTADVTGSVGTRLKPLNLPPVDASEAALSNDNEQIPLIPEGNSWKSCVDENGNLLLDGTKTLDMPPGTYYFNDFVLTGKAVFNTSGPTKIYITGDLERSGGTIVNNNTKRAANLQIFMTGGTATVTSDNSFYGTIYGPNTAITTDGSADLFGVVVGRTLTVAGSGKAHYDESLEAFIEDGLPRRIALVD